MFAFKNTTKISSFNMTSTHSSKDGTWLDLTWTHITMRLTCLSFLLPSPTHLIIGLDFLAQAMRLVQKHNLSCNK